MRLYDGIFASDLVLSAMSDKPASRRFGPLWHMRAVHMVLWIADSICANGSN